jgi:hypothetical protein
LLRRITLSPKKSKKVYGKKCRKLLLRKNKSGDLDENGTPIIAVIADGAWKKRSHRTNYNAASRVASSIGADIKKNIFMGVRNKYCTVCERISTQNSEKADNHHVCFNNYNGPSTAMETDVILDRFRKSVDMDDVIYGKLIADEDSSVYKKRLHRTVLSSTSKKLSARTTF